jgi:lysophospholipase L1-like esterase
MKKLLMMMMLIASTTMAQAADRVVAASSGEVSFTGRVQVTADGGVRYDWSGVYLQTDFTGNRIAVDISDEGTSYHNVFIDGKWVKKIKVSGTNTQTIELAKGLKGGTHRLRLQKCTEGEFGRTTIHALRIAPGASLKAVPKASRFIEVIGDSYTCGYGTESNKAEDPFKLETENCNQAYGCIVARYFGADYALVSHSGFGLVRNYGAKGTSTTKSMSTRYPLLFDEHDSIGYDFKGYRPDLVIINLGTNDFSTSISPDAETFAQAYVDLIKKVRSHYGEVPVLCVTPHSANNYLKAAMEVVRDKTLALPKVFMADPMDNMVMYGHDLGASWHPNYQGQRKIAMSLIPQISAIMGWDLPKGKSVE